MQLSMSGISAFQKYDSVNILNPVTSHSYYKKQTTQIAAECIPFPLYYVEKLNSFSKHGTFQALISVIFFEKDCHLFNDGH